MKSVHDKIKLSSQDRHILREHSFAMHGVHGNAYPKTMVDKKPKALHHFILPRKKGFDVDHINRDVFDARRKNLRYVTRSQNMMNATKYKSNTSGHRGVTWNKPAKKWIASIRIDRKLRHLGCFTNKEDAAKAYLTAAKKLFGVFLGEI